MNLFEIDFLEKLKVILKEAFSFKKYKAMNPVLAVFTGIFMIPWVLASFLVIAAFALLAFAIAVVSAPVKYFHGAVHAEGQSVKHAPQTVIYLISWPVISIMYLIMSFLMLWIIPVYAILSILLYVWSLGGFKFHLFMDKSDDISITVNDRYNALPAVFVAICALITVVLPAIHEIALFIDLYYNYMERYFIYAFIGQYSEFILANNIFTLLFSLIGFAGRPKAKKSKISIAKIEE